MQHMSPSNLVTERVERTGEVVCPVCGDECTHFEATSWEFAGRARHGRPLATCPNGHHVLPLDEAIAEGFVPAVSEGVRRSRKGRKKAMSDNFATQPGSDEAAERLLVCDKCAAIWSWDRDDNDPFTSYEYEIGTEHAGCGGRKREPGDDRLKCRRTD